MSQLTQFLDLKEKKEEDGSTLVWFEPNREKLLKYCRSYEEEKDAGENLCDFYSKESYLDWVDEWKELWNLLSYEQREIRIALSKSHVSPDLTESIQPEGYGYKISKLDYYRMIRWQNKWILRILLHAREFGKLKSWEMKLKQMQESE